MTQVRVNAVHRLTRELVARLRYFLGSSGMADASAMADKCTDQFAERLHDDVCEHLGLDPGLANQRAAGGKVHPWNQAARARKPKA